MSSRNQNVSFTLDDLPEFFDARQAGSWIRWMTDSSGGYLYFDDKRNVEVYGTEMQIHAWLAASEPFLKMHELTVKAIESEKGINPNVLQANRACVYNQESYPKMAWLTAMVESPGVYDGECRAYVQSLKDADIFKGVDVQIFVQDPEQWYLDVPKFRDFKPLGLSTWMLWGEDRSDEVRKWVYTDSDADIEVYTPDLMKTIRGLSPSNYHLYVKVDKDLFDRTGFARELSVARSRLYTHTNVLQASEDQLQEMVMRIKDMSEDQRRDLKNWDPYGNEEKGDQLAEWTYKPTAGRLPVPPQFYFNPKPLKKGDPSKPPKASMVTLVDLKLGGAYGDEYE
jgi:hypothetical protein